MTFKYWASTAVVFVTLLLSCLINIGLPQSLSHSQYCSSFPIFVSQHWTYVVIIVPMKYRIKTKINSWGKVISFLVDYKTKLHFVKKKYFSNTRLLFDSRNTEPGCWEKSNKYCLQIHILIKQCFPPPTLLPLMIANPLFS